MVNQKYQDTSLSPEERAENLMSQMSLEEKLGQIECFSRAHLVGKDPKKLYPQGFGQVSNLLATALPDEVSVAEMVNTDQKLAMSLSEHHIPALFHIEALCGVLIAKAKSFPAGIGQASTWNPQLQHQLGLQIGEQAHAVGMRQVAAPVLDITRDPRFGRLGESYGEDPTLASAMGTAFVKGLQHDGDLTKGVLATSKHFLGFQHGEGGIHSARTPIVPRELREVYAKPFQAAITDGGLGSVMNSYGEIDGDPVISSRKILTDLLRKEMKFDGYVVSDYMSMERLKDVFHTASDYTVAGVQSLEAGMDAELPVIHCYDHKLIDLIKNGQLNQKYLDRAVFDTLVVKFKLGLFEHPFALPVESLKKVYQSATTTNSSQAAQESLILLKNDGILPLKPQKKTIAVIGCHADSVRSYFGGYTYMAMKESTVGVKVTMAGIDVDDDSPVNSDATKSKTYSGSIVHRQNREVEALTRDCYPQSKSLVDELKGDCPDTKITYAYGYPYAGNDQSGFEEALNIARQADTVILTLGGKYGWNMASTTGEGIDAMSINLPECQEEFLTKVAELNKPMIGIHFDGRPISSDAADKYLNAIIEAWAPGEFGGPAIVDTLLGKKNPSGKLPVTVARTSGQLPVYYNHDNGSGIDAGPSMAFNSYVDGTRTPRYPFGFGLSYTNFNLGNLQVVGQEVSPDQSIELQADVTNTGSVPGDEVVQLYYRDQVASVVRPVKQLAGFQKVSLAAGEKTTVKFVIQPSLMSFLDSDMNWKIEAGKFELMLGTSSTDLPLSTTVTVSKDKLIDGTKRQFVATSEAD
ncbi:glycoside hydrolase family 3 N-terminal domain-containing protein [Levilactobacillus fujinensis]|uniref:Glycoside hydrolase family 3 N-terminal domain-containing protein n=1 Tax=Levilactobacillus fujinensis TaxID=2486024 RepID=A0ABW1TG78_9LACO|nr:glycoside hydrolase family 3 N-terminal domain-containing protein [Levilactobacillus fujinensis]